MFYSVLIKFVHDHLITGMSSVIIVVGDSGMDVVGLISGGKDSCYNMMCAVKQGHRIVALANLHPPEGNGELDSFMYQSVGSDGVKVGVFFLLQVLITEISILNHIQEKWI
uniref:Diphthamide synthetase n=1 Tax=Heterorhabditis bacteriophora TaxID=37862 RepID=A0A1I7XPP1_HETBA